MIYAKWIEDDGRFGFSLSDNGGRQITASVRDALLSAEAMGKRIAPDAEGFPVALDPPGPTAEKLAETERAWRDEVLFTLVGLRDRHRDEVELGLATTLTDEQYSGLLVYMQALRDWPQSDSFPDREQRPAAPTWIAVMLE